MEATDIDVFVRRTRLWLGAAFVAFTAVAGTATWAVQKMTTNMQDKLNDTHDDLVALTVRMDRRAEADSIRFERGMVILNLAVGAIVEIDPAEKQSAVTELRRLRHYTP